MRHAPGREVPSWIQKKRVTRVAQATYGMSGGPGGHVYRAQAAQLSSVREALRSRLERLVGCLVVELPEHEAGRAVSAPTDLEALEAALERATFVQASRDPAIAAAYARGHVARQRLLDSEGGMVSGEVLGKLLGISRQAVDKRRNRGQVLGLREGGDWAYPAWQVAQGQTLPGFDDVLGELTGRGHGAWDAMLFFLETDTERDGETPLQALRGGAVERALCAARTYGEQGAR